MRRRDIGADEPVGSDVRREGREGAGGNGDPVIAPGEAERPQPVGMDQRRTRVGDRPARHAGAGRVRAHRTINPSRREPFQKREQRQPQNRRMRAFDRLEQMDADPLDLIGADAREQGGPAGRAIARNRRVVERAHRQPRAVGGLEEDSAVARNADGRDQRMGPAGEPAQSPRGRGEVLGLVHQGALDQQGLIGADAQRGRAPAAHLKRLGAREQRGDLRGVAAAGEEVLFEPSFVDRGGDRGDRQPRRFQKGAAGLARGGENWRDRLVPERRHGGQGCASSIPGDQAWAMNFSRCIL